MKQRMSLVDTIAMCSELQSLVGYRVVNVYDVDNRTYLLKLYKADAPKATLVMESGSRFHTTRYARAKSKMPSGFSTKLRKHMKSRKLRAIRLLGVDRVVDFEFGGEEKEHQVHLILELYAAGNVVLTDGNYSIMTLLRRHKLHDADVNFAVRQSYPVPHLQQAGEEDGKDGGASQTDDGRLIRTLIPSVGHDEAASHIRGLMAVALAKELTGKAKRNATLRNLLVSKDSPFQVLG